MHRILNGENPVKVWGDGNAIRDFAYSKDIAKGTILALYHGTGGKYVNLGSGNGVTIKELLETLKKFIDFDYEVTLLTILDSKGNIHFCPPIGHFQERGDYQYSWQPAKCEQHAVNKMKTIAR